MDDIFYMSAKKVSIRDVEEAARRANVKDTFVPKTSDIVQIEYNDGIVADWFCMDVEEFCEPEAKKFLDEHKIESIFCVSHHQVHFTSMLPHIKILLQEYGGWIGDDGDGFQPCYDLQALNSHNIVYGHPALLRSNF